MFTILGEKKGCKEIAKSRGIRQEKRKKEKPKTEEKFRFSPISHMPVYIVTVLYCECWEWRIVLSERNI